MPPKPQPPRWFGIMRAGERIVGLAALSRPESTLGSVLERADSPHNAREDAGSSKLRAGGAQLGRRAQSRPATLRRWKPSAHR